MFIFAEKLDEWITEVVLQRLDSPAMHQFAWGGHPDEEQTRALTDAIQEDADRLDDLATIWPDGAISKADRQMARARIEARRGARITVTPCCG